MTSDDTVRFTAAVYDRGNGREQLQFRKCVQNGFYESSGDGGLSSGPTVWQRGGMRGCYLTAFLILVVVARAGRVDDLGRIHLEALGGKARVSALAAVQANGTVVTGGTRVRFTMIAARPAKLRIELERAGRTKVQGYDGTDSPWEFDTGSWPPRYQAMPANSAKAFIADAEFDDPLVAGAAGGYTFVDGGEVQAGKATLLRILVTRNLTETFSVLLDPDTYLIVMRVEQRVSAVGRAIQIVTRFEDYRPVEGVLLAHRVTLVVDGRVSQETLIDSIEGNPAVHAETFSRPKAIPPKPAS